MLIVPASKVSVPLTVVMRTRSRVPDKVTEPPPIKAVPVSLRPKTALLAQVLEVTFTTVAIPCLVTAAADVLSVKSPVVEFNPDGVAVIFIPEPVYPETVKDPDPS
jgi:hypothetical protein